jgi:hypothetical protein
VLLPLPPAQMRAQADSYVVSLGEALFGAAAAAAQPGYAAWSFAHTRMLSDEPAQMPALPYE